MDALRIGSLCTGYAGLDVAVQAVIGGEHAWMAENDPHASKVLAHHWPDVPNHGDITAIDWAGVEPVDIIAAGFPCTNISNAGNREGITGEQSRVWKNVAEAIRVLRPGLVVLENVAVIRSRGLDVVAADLAAIGYDAQWTSLRASEIGAPHPRDRWFCIAYPAVPDAERGGWHRWTGDLAEAQGWPEPAHRGDEAADPGVALLPTPVVADARGTRNFTAGRRPGAKFNSGKTLTDVAWLLPTPKASDGRHGGPNHRTAAGRYYLPGMAVRLDEHWVSADGVDYAPAIRRWEAILGRPAPEPTEAGTRGNRRLTAPFVEWMLGLPSGHVTDVPDITRPHQIRILGGGVVPLQGIAAIESLLATALGLEAAA